MALLRTESSLPLLQAGWPLVGNEKENLHGSRIPTQKSRLGPEISGQCSAGPHPSLPKH